MNNDFEYKRGLNTGTRQERDRIIKLITNEREKAALAFDHQTRLLATSLIALIKGDNE